VLENEAILRLIEAMLDSPHFAYSTSMLNDYRACPMEFFFKRILGLQPIEEIIEEPERAEIGTAVHAILAKFYSSWRDTGQRRITPENRVHALVGMLEAAMSILESHHRLGGDRIDAWAVRNRITHGLHNASIWKDNTLLRLVEQREDLPRQDRGPLRILIDYEADMDLPLFPWSMEFDFGFDDRSPLVLSGAAGKPIRIRGKIDRIDIHPEKSRPEGVTAWIFDYKTGRTPSMAQIKAGVDLQLPVYLLAALEGLGDLRIGNAAACFMSLIQGEENLRKNIIYTEGIPKDLQPTSRRSSWGLSAEDLDGFRKNIRDIDESIRKGEFPRTEIASQCERCPYKSVCFRDVHRVRVLSQV
jgi:RecB family exonuclease